VLEENHKVAKPLRCRLRLHAWEDRENPETGSGIRSAFAACKGKLGIFAKLSAVILLS
jgi:hypothetical protein